MSEDNGGPSPVSPQSPSATPCALQFITINEKGDSFELKEDVLKRVLDTVPEDMPISVVCVVGAFRTGKSFILDLFLRYLRHTSDPTAVSTQGEMDHSKSHEEWLFKGGTKLEGIYQESEEQGTEKNHLGFSWRPGTIRNTTGMWIWSEPFIRRNPLFSAGNKDEPEEVAVLLVDTQGMFDMLTAQMLTAAIFGLSTLVSSYLVYNVDKRIQEDNLQHLALFTEYGRIALGAVEEDAGHTSKRQPFQTLQFLVRDFQDYDDEDDVEGCVAEMEPYLDRVLQSSSATTHKDIAEVRTHINMCFERPSVFMLPHPGSEVTKKKYSGDLTVVNPAFCALLNRLAVSIFGTNCAKPSLTQQKLEKGAVVCKRVGDHGLTAQELLGYVRNYVRVFHEAVHGQGVFPEAKTLLAATAEANNYNAMEKGVKRYKDAMDQVCGSKQKYVPQDKIDECHERNKKQCLDYFDKIATMGSRDKIVDFRERLEVRLQDMYEEYAANNHNKRPNFLQFLTILVIVSASTYIAASVINVFCWPPATLPFDFEYADMCNGTMSALRDVYLTVFCFVLITLFGNCWDQIQPFAQVMVRTASDAGMFGSVASDKKKKE